MHSHTRARLSAGPFRFVTAGDSDGEYATQTQFGYTYNDVESVIAKTVGGVDVSLNCVVLLVYRVYRRLRAGKQGRGGGGGGASPLLYSPRHLNGFATLLWNANVFIVFFV